MYDIALIRMVSRELSSIRGCEFMKSIGYEPGIPIVVADSNERLVDVFSRMEATDGALVYVAAYYKDRGRLSVMPFSRGQTEDVCETLRTDSGSQSTIGMLMDDVRNRKAPVHIIIDEIRDTNNLQVSDYGHELVH